MPYQQITTSSRKSWELIQLNSSPPGLQRRRPSIFASRWPCKLRMQSSRICKAKGAFAARSRNPSGKPRREDHGATRCRRHLQPD